MSWFMHAAYVCRFVDLAYIYLYILHKRICASGIQGFVHPACTDVCILSCMHGFVNPVYKDLCIFHTQICAPVIHGFVHPSYTDLCILHTQIYDDTQMKRCNRSVYSTLSTMFYFIESVNLRNETDICSTVSGCYRAGTHRRTEHNEPPRMWTWWRTWGYHSARCRCLHFRLLRISRFGRKRRGMWWYLHFW